MSDDLRNQDAIDKFAKIAQDLTGVQLTDRHREMIRSRLQKRIQELGLESIDAYLTYFHQHLEEEKPKLIGLLTTHHTYFFREFSHFEFIASQALPALVAEVKARPDKKLRVWSAACSRGQEVYSLAMYLDFHLKRLDPSIGFEILGTDVDPESVEIAKNGVYPQSELKEVPLSMLGSHWIRGTGDIAEFVKARNSIRSLCRFQPGNLLALSTGGITEKFDLILCRNVFIYFNSDQIKQITNALLARMTSTGYLFIGISESLSQLKLPVKSLAPSVYQHESAVKQAKVTPEAKKTSVASVPAPAVSALPHPIRVLCVDDSPSVLTLMKRVFAKEKGFEIIGTALNGKEAAEKIPALKPDAVTLDIHMPEMTGIEYLEKHYRQDHPPIVMVTSVSRENAELAGRALTLGAADYVEKPAMTNLEERAEEIRTKVRCAVSAKQFSVKSSLSLDKEFQSKSGSADPHRCLRLFLMSLSQRAKLKAVLGELRGSQPPCLLMVDGGKDALPAMAEVLSKELGRKVQFSDQTPSNIGADEIWLIDIASQAQPIWEKFGKFRKNSILVFGDVAASSAAKIKTFAGAQIVLEDLGGGKGTAPLMGVAKDVVLVTSFAYLSDEFLSGNHPLPSSTAGKKAA